MNSISACVRAKHVANLGWIQSFRCRKVYLNVSPMATSIGIRRNSSYQGWVWEMINSKPVLMTQETLQYSHDFLNLPWWATIILTTCALRATVTLPLTVYQHYIGAKYTNLQPEFKSLAEELKKETMMAIKLYNWPKEKARYMYNKSLRKHINALVIKENCHPMKGSLVIWLQIPMWICVSLALRGMSIIPAKDLAAQITLLNLSVGGTLWFPNLIFPDPTMILPILLGLINLAIIEMHAMRAAKTSRLQTITSNILRAFSILMIPIAGTVPSCLALYWTTSSAFGLVQNAVLMSPRFRQICRIPVTRLDSATPYRDLLSNIKKKLRL